MSDLPTTEKKQAFEQLIQRSAQNDGITKKNNAMMHAGSPMYYYCQICDQEMILPESHTCPAPTHCDECKSMKNKGWIE